MTLILATPVLVKQYRPLNFTQKTVGSQIFNFTNMWFCWNTRQLNYTQKSYGLNYLYSITHFGIYFYFGINCWCWNQEAPEFAIDNLPPGTGFTIRLLAFNPKGESDRVELRGSTLGVDTQKHIRYNNSNSKQQVVFSIGRYSWI